MVAASAAMKGPATGPFYFLSL